MFKIYPEQIAELRKPAAAEWLVRSFEGSKQLASVDAQSGDVLIADPVGHRTQFALDSHGFIGSITSPLGRSYRFSNDPEGKVRELATPSGLLIRNGYDSTGRLERVHRGSTLHFELSYGDSGQIDRIAFMDGTSVQLDYSDDGALVATTDRLGATERYERDVDGNIVALEDGNGNRTTFAYGGWDRPDKAIFPDGSSESYDYDDNGFVRQLTASDGTTLEIVNDPDGHPCSISDGRGEGCTFAYDPTGRVLQARNADSSVSFEYDSEGRVLREMQGRQAVEYRYDEAGTLVGVRYPTGEWVEFGYDADMRLSGLRDWSGNSHSITYAQNDSGFQIRLSSGLLTSVRQAESGLPTSISVFRRGQIRRELFVLAYEYDVQDRVRQFSDSDFGSRAYRYDAEGRLLEVVPDTELGRVERFSYDAAGNHTAHNRTQNTHDVLNRLVRQGSAFVGYDARGNLTSDGAWRFAYDPRNRLTRADRYDGRRVSFGYDAFGRRIWKRTDTVEVRYLWAGEHLIREVVHEGETTRSQDYLYYPGTPTPFATRIDGEVYFYHTDHLGTPRRLTNRAGEIVWAADYSAYGRAQVTVERVRNALRFPGQYHDEETGLHYNRFRYYAPELGRYTSRDPLSFLVGPNLYVYSDNDPINSADPLGLWSWKTVASVAAAVAVGAAVVAFAPVAAPIAIIAAGVAAGAVGAGLNEALHQEKLCVPCILRAAGKGALVGGVAALPFALLPATAGVAAYTGAGAASGAASHLAEYLTNYPDARWSWSAFGTSVALGAATAGLSRYVSTRLMAPSAKSQSPSQIARNRQTGIIGERRVGLIKNTKRIPSATNPSRYRIPDGLTQTTISEVKNVAKLGYTSQLKDFATFARQTGRTFDLYVRPTTQLSGPLRNAIRQGLINLKFIP